MKNNTFRFARFAVLTFLALFVATSSVSTSFAIDYSNPESWIVCQNDEQSTESTDYDVFYIYPTLIAESDSPIMDWNKPEEAARTINFVKAQTAIFGPHARVFAPGVRQAVYAYCSKDLEKGNNDWETTVMRTGIGDTADAFAYYLEHFNSGRPFILAGHSQGSIHLYCLLKNNRKISVENGFIAAYLVGIPQLTLDRFQKDLAGREIVPATGATDLGVVIVWHTQNATTTESLFSGPGVLCINPLNWRTDETPAPKSANLGSSFYNAQTGETSQEFQVCGAQIDLKKGALIVDLPENSKYDGQGVMGVGVFHISDVWLFAENLRKNMEDRAAAYKATYKK